MIIAETETVELSTATGPMRSYIFRPVAGGRYPGLVLYSEIYQVTGPIRRIAAFLAGHGFVVLVPEVYHELEPPGTVLNYDKPDTERGNQHKITKPLSSYDSDARAALDFLHSFPHCTGKLGVMGICLGGHLAFRAAMNKDVLAGVCFYATDIHTHNLGKGQQDDSLDRVAEIKGELLMGWGRQDPHIPREGRAEIYNALSDYGVNFQWHEFNTAHAFLRDEGHRYDPAATQISYGMILELLKRKLSEGDVQNSLSSG
ncbi:MAG: dienelactone hydrolase family protein [Nitrospirae bacterium]|nr:dienelactone hydrolase family protein [Nitrospirota bacterium]MDA1303129.1 dienelactone hydrolase family protein [Nitrospirota bacterium]